MNIIYAVFLFGFLIFIHELGHFIAAKASGVKVLKFSLGFGPVIIGRRFGDTEYVLSAVPLGGYVKMLGEEPEDEVPDQERADSYPDKPVYRRAAIVFCGPLFNLLTAVAIFFFIFLVGVPTLKPVVGELLPGAPAERAGLLKGDRVTEVSGQPVTKWSELSDIIHKSPAKELRLLVKRGDAEVTVPVTPENKKVKDLFGEEVSVGLIGVKPSEETFIVREGFFSAIGSAFSKTWEISKLTLIGMVKLIQRIIPADTIGGPILIFQLASKQASVGALNYFSFAAVISINLGVLNLLPIPVLDGGHLVFLGLEAIRKRPLSERVIIMSQRVGMALLITLMVFAMYNDIFRLISGKPLP